MSIAKTKKEIVTDFQKHPTDTRSSEVQIDLITERIISLTEHFKKHKKDHHSETEKARNSGLLLPIYFELSDSEQDFVVDTLIKAISKTLE